MLTKQQMYQMFDIKKRGVRFKEPANDRKYDDDDDDDNDNGTQSLKKRKVNNSNTPTAGANEQEAAPEASETAPTGPLDKSMNAQLQAKAADQT